MPGLLDPALDDIVPPLMQVLSSALEHTVSGEVNAARLARVGRMINWVVKVRGWKAVVPHFPSSLPHLHTLITLLSPPRSSSSTNDPRHHPALSTDDAWELRAVLLLWLALLLTVPFSLAALSDEPKPTGLDVRTHERLFAVPMADLAVRVTLLAVPLLHRPGREGEYAALVLARLLARDDAVQGLQGFFDWAAAELQEGEREREASLVASLLAFLAFLPAMIAPAHLRSLAHFLEDQLIPHLAGGQTSASSGLIRKLAIKARGRWWLSRLGRGYRDSEELPDGIEEALDDFMTALSDKDTIVRYSAAKYLARVAALLPAGLADQIAEATIDLFAGTEEEPMVETSFGTIVDPGGSAAGGGHALSLGGLEVARGEGRWHGVCLAVAEMARRGLLGEEAVAKVVPLIVKALTFDLRRGSHSVGANVRDAASYVLWSLSRASSSEQLASFAESIATALVSAAVLDREVGVRRAASAAYQEGVGRLGLYPEGIEILALTDFYSVSVRRKAFTTAAPAVATHAVYREPLRNRLHNITLRHWDSAMRTAGAALLPSLLKLAPDTIGDSMSREIVNLSSLDPTSCHGALLALSEMACLVDEEAKAKVRTESARADSQMLQSLVKVRAAALITTNAAEIIAAGCCLAASAMTPTVDLMPAQRFIDAALKRREQEVHDALGSLCRQISLHRDGSAFVARSIADLDSSRPTQRQAASLCLGQYVYQTPETISTSLEALFHLIDPAAKATVETRRNVSTSLADLACQTTDKGLLVTAQQFQRIVEALTTMLGDYSTDQRGDVGSWIRMASLVGLGRVLTIAASNDPLHLVPQATFTYATSAIVKQAMEKLDAVREVATTTWEQLLACSADTIWEWPQATCMTTPEGIRPPADWFTAGLPLLQTPARFMQVWGLLQSVGSGTSLTPTSQRALNPLVAFLKVNTALIPAVLNDINDILASDPQSNRVSIPGLNTLSRLLEADIHASEPVQLRSLALATRGLTTIRSIERLTSALGVIAASLNLPFAAVRTKAASAIPAILGHRFPRIRGIGAEKIYLTLSEREMDPELEELILETTWTDDVDDQPAKVAELVTALIN